MPKTYRVAVAGSTGRGNYGHGLDTAWQAVSQTQIVAVSDDNDAGRAAAAKRLKVEKAYADFRKMLDEAKPDILAICPRWVDQHAGMALAAAERGVHVYMEKPLCRTVAEADAIAAACEKTKVKLTVAHPTRYSPMIDTIKKLIAEGQLGTVLEYRGRGKEDRRGGGEDLWVLGTHIMDMIRAIGGAPKWCYARVTSNGTPITKADVIDGAEGIGPLAGDGVEAMFGMPDGSTAYFSSHRNAAGRPSRYGLQVHGSKGVLELLEGTLPSVKVLLDSGWSPGQSGKAWQPVSSAGVGKPEPLTGPQYRARHTLAILDFLDAIETNRQPKCGVLEARGITEMIAACFESARVGDRVELPLKTRENPLALMTK
jgi:predicted dehydrogenase